MTSNKLNSKINSQNGGDTMEEKILSILLSMQSDITTIKDDQAIMKEDISKVKKDVSGLKEDVSGLKEDMAGVKKEQKTMRKKMETLQKTVNSIQAEQKEMKKTQEDMLEELRLSNLRLAKVTEKLTNTVEENNKEHKEFDSRIIELEIKAV